MMAKMAGAEVEGEGFKLQGYVDRGKTTHCLCFSYFRSKYLELVPKPGKGVPYNLAVLMSSH